jgi:hypothetical protein
MVVEWLLNRPDAPDDGAVKVTLTPGSAFGFPEEAFGVLTTTASGKANAVPVFAFCFALAGLAAVVTAELASEKFADIPGAVALTL